MTMTTKDDVLGVIFALIFVLLVFGSVAGCVYGCNRALDHHRVDIKFKDGSTRSYSSRSSYVNGGFLVIRDDDEIRLIKPYNNFSFPLDSIESWKRVY